MKTIIVKGSPVAITGPMADIAAESSLLKSWVDSIELKAFILKAIEIQSLDISFHNKGQVAFIKMKIFVFHPDGITEHPHPKIVFLRGDAVVILPILILNGKKFVVLVNQLRIPVGGMINETLAGTLEGSSDPTAVVLREIEEEAKLVSVGGFTAGDIFPLFGGKKMFSSPGALDEGIYPFYAEREISQEVFDQLTGVEGGLEEEDEYIKLKLIPYDDVSKNCTDTKTLATLYLYEHRND